MLAYLARYTHRVAISNSRLIAADADGVTFRYKDYRRRAGPLQDHDAGPASSSGASCCTSCRRASTASATTGCSPAPHQGEHRARPGAARRARAANGARPDDERRRRAADRPSPPCPCCGGRMIIIETFERGGGPRARPARPGIRTEAHDPQQSLTASQARRRPRAAGDSRTPPRPLDPTPRTANRTDIDRLGARDRTLATARRDRSADQPSQRLHQTRPQRRPRPRQTSNPHRPQTPRPAPAGSFLGGFRTPAPALPAHLDRPASETLHTTGTQAGSAVVWPRWADRPMPSTWRIRCVSPKRPAKADVIEPGRPVRAGAQIYSFSSAKSYGPSSYTSSYGSSGSEKYAAGLTRTYSGAPDFDIVRIEENHVGARSHRARVYEAVIAARFDEQREELGGPVEHLLFVRHHRPGHVAGKPAQEAREFDSPLQQLNEEKDSRSTGHG